MKIKNACILGGTGFVGRNMVHRLTNQGIFCRVLSRRPHRHQALTTGNRCEVLYADVFDTTQLANHFKGFDVVINLIGILNQQKKQGFRRVHVKLVDHIVDACRTARVPRILHMSALNADEGAGVSLYLRSKGEGENRMHTLARPDIAVTSFRPSVIFGPDDSFINRFAGLLGLPGPLPLACYAAEFSPVYINDVVEAFTLVLEDPASFGRHYELCGPQSYQLIEIVRYIARHMNLHKRIIPLADWISRLQAMVLQRLPGKIFTMDNYRSMQKPSTCKTDGLAQLGIQATHMDQIVPMFLRTQSEGDVLNQLRHR